MKSRRSKTLWWILGIVAVGAGAFFAGRGGKASGPEKVDIRTAKAEKTDVQVRVTEVGQVEPVVKVDVKAILSGRVVALNVREGDQVKKGDVLAVLEPDINQARELSQVRSSINEARIMLEQAQKNYERDKVLVDKGLLATRDGLAGETNYRAAKAQHEAALEKMRIVRESGVPIEMAGSATQRMNVTSPMDGVVIRKSVELGDAVTGVGSFNAGSVLATVAEVSTMIVKVGVNEVDVGKVRLQQAAKVTLDAYPKVKFGGTITRLSPAARYDDLTKVKVFDVEIALNAQGTELRTGMTANVDILGDERKQVLSIPVEGLFRRDDGEFVYLKKAVAAGDKKDKKDDAKIDEKDRWKEHFEIRTVETGLASLERIEITKGLKLGDEVAVEDPTKPKEKKDEDD